MDKKIGIMVGREWSWPPAFIEEVNRRNEGVTAEFVKVGGTRMDEPNPYAVIVDRISHEIPYYRAYLKHAMMSGTTVINNPFWWSADDKFTGAILAQRLGIAHPRTVALPTHAYIEGIDLNESLRNLEFPIPWEKHIEYVGGFPVILKPAWGGGFKSVYKVHTIEQLWEAYNQTGTECMMLQEFINWDNYARCLCIGKDNIMPIKFDVSAPWPHRYFDEPGFLSAEEGRLVVDWARKLCHALGYDMNTVEFAIKDGIPYAIDFTNPAPDFDVNSLMPKYFDWVVNQMADLCIAKAKEERPQADPYWSTLLYGQMSDGTQSVQGTQSSQGTQATEGTQSTEATTAPAKRTSRGAKAQAVGGEQATEEAATKKRAGRKGNAQEIGG